jgi:hypothetical protein
MSAQFLKSINFKHGKVQDNILWAKNTFDPKWESQICKTKKFSMDGSAFFTPPSYFGTNFIAQILLYFYLFFKANC